MENIALSGCICAVQCQHRHKLFLSSGEIRQSDRLLSVDAFKLIIAVSLMERWFVTEN